MPRFRFKHIANRMLFWILGVCLLIFLGFSALLYQQTSLIINTLVTRLLTQVLEFQQGQVFDDITLLAIRREPI